jgi:hypothetical protein
MGPGQAGSAGSPAPQGEAPVTRPTPVEKAFAFGWHLAELRNVTLEHGGAPPSGEAPAGCLSQVHNFDLKDRADLLARQLEDGLGSLPSDTSNAFRDVLEAIQKAVEPNSTTALNGLLDKLKDEHVELLKILTSKDFRLGKAYGIGVQLAETVLLSYAALRATSRPPSSPAPPIEKESKPGTLELLWNPKRIQLLVVQLRELKTAFQDYAVDATTATLLDWSKTSAKWSRASEEELRRTAEDHLYPQGAAWRAMLSGEKLPTDFLQVSEYVKAISNLLRDYASFAWRFLRSSPWLLLALGLVLAVLAGAAFIALQNPAQVQAGYATLIAVLGVFGVSTATVAAAVKKALSTAEEHLWQAETAYAIAVAINWVPVKPADSEVDRLGRLTVQDPRPD